MVKLRIYNITQCKDRYASDQLQTEYQQFSSELAVMDKVSLYSHDGCATIVKSRQLLFILIALYSTSQTDMPTFYRWKREHVESTDSVILRQSPNLTTGALVAGPVIYIHNLSSIDAEYDKFTSRIFTLTSAITYDMLLKACFKGDSDITILPKAIDSIRKTRVSDAAHELDRIRLNHNRASRARDYWLPLDAVELDFHANIHLNISRKAFYDCALSNAMVLYSRPHVMIAVSSFEGHLSVFSLPAKSGPSIQPTAHFNLLLVLFTIEHYTCRMVEPGKTIILADIEFSQYLKSRIESWRVKIVHPTKEYISDMAYIIAWTANIVVIFTMTDSPRLVDVILLSSECEVPDADSIIIDVSIQSSMTSISDIYLVTARSMYHIREEVRTIALPPSCVETIQEVIPCSHSSKIYLILETHALLISQDQLSVPYSPPTGELKYAECYPTSYFEDSSGHVELLSSDSSTVLLLDTSSLAWSRYPEPLMIDDSITLFGPGIVPGDFHPKIRGFIAHPTSFMMIAHHVTNCILELSLRIDSSVSTILTHMNSELALIPTDFEANKVLPSRELYRILLSASEGNNVDVNITTTNPIDAIVQCYESIATHARANYDSGEMRRNLERLSGSANFKCLVHILKGIILAPFTIHMEVHTMSNKLARIIEGCDDHTRYEHAKSSSESALYLPSLTSDTEWDIWNATHYCIFCKSAVLVYICNHCGSIAYPLGEESDIRQLSK